MSEIEKDAPAEKPAPRLLGVRSTVVPLDFPVDYDGKVYSEITVTRMTGAQVIEFVNMLKESGSRANLPMFDVPREVIDALDADDAEALDEAVFNFLPHRLMGEDGRMREAGADTSPSSEAS